MDKYFVLCDTAILLGHKGFDEPCLFFYNLPSMVLQQVSAWNAAIIEALKLINTNEEVTKEYGKAD